MNSDKEYQKALKEFRDYKSRREREKQQEEARDRLSPEVYRQQRRKQREEHYQKEFEKHFQEEKTRAEAFRRAQAFEREANQLLGIASSPPGSTTAPFVARPPMKTEQEEYAEAKREFDQARKEKEARAAQEREEKIQQSYARYRQRKKAEEQFDRARAWKEWEKVEMGNTDTRTKEQQGRARAWMEWEEAEREQERKAKTGPSSTTTSNQTKTNKKFGSSKTETDWNEKSRKFQEAREQQQKERERLHAEWEEHLRKLREDEAERDKKWQARLRGVHRQVDNDAYNVLGLQPGVCTLRDVKARFVALAQEHHPDKGGDSQAYMRIYTAYETLSKTLSRA